MAIGGALAGADTVGMAPTWTPARGEQARQLARGVLRRVVDRGLARRPRAEAVVHGERTERADLAVGAVRVLPRRDVPDGVVAGVVADDPAGDPADALGDDASARAFEAGGDVTLRLGLGLEEGAVLAGGEHGIAAADQPHLIDGAVGGRGRCDGSRLVGEVGPEGLQRRRGDEHLLCRRADERSVGIVDGQLCALPSTTKHVPSPPNSSSSVRCRCCAPTASTTGCGTRRADHTGVPTAGPVVAVLLAALSSVNASATATTAPITRIVATTRCQMLMAASAVRGTRARRQRCSSAVTARLADQ